MKQYALEHNLPLLQPEKLKDEAFVEALRAWKADLQPVYEMGWKAPERFKVKAADGVTDLYGVMWKPADFDSTKVYPIISNVYPGPFFEYVPTRFTINDVYNTRLAQLGFIVITVGQDRKSTRLNSSH